MPQPSRASPPSPRGSPAGLLRTKRGLWVAGGLVVLAVVLGMVWRLAGPQSPTSSLPVSAPSSGSGAVTSSTPSEPSSTLAQGAAGSESGGRFAKLVGRWLRPDGGYVLEIRAVDGLGRIDAAYLNPRPIHVGRAEAKEEGGKLLVEVEFQDVNYPGSTYRLTYFPQTDQLYGTYYQATMGQTFDVDFQRLP